MSSKRFDAKKKPSRFGEYDGDDPDDDDAHGEFPSLPDDEKRKKGTSSSGNRRNGSRDASLPACQADECVADMSDAKQYHRRHKVCEVHAKAPAVTVSGLRQRFCQQCSRFHELHEFDESKRSCRSRLEGHNERRRRCTGDYHGGELWQQQARKLSDKGKSMLATRREREGSDSDPWESSLPSNSIG